MISSRRFGRSLAAVVVTLGVVVLPSTPAMAATVPGAPTGLTATVGGCAAFGVRWTPPVNNGGSPITGYVILATPNKNDPSYSKVRLGNVTSYTVSPLMAFQTYVVAVWAVNAVGTGPVVVLNVSINCAMARVSVGTGGTQANGESGEQAVSANLSSVMFGSAASNLVSGDTNGKRDVFVRDRMAGTTTRVSVATGGTQANGDSFPGTISADGRFVAFESAATNLVGGDTNGVVDAFVRDLVARTTTRVSVGTGGTQANGQVRFPRISADGRYVTFESPATNLVGGDTNGMSDVFRRDLVTGTTTRVSVATGGVQANRSSGQSAISGDGRSVAFYSWASNLVSGDTNGVPDVFVRDLVAGTTTRVSVTAGGGQANGESGFPAISQDGRYAVFYSSASNLVGGDTNAKIDVFVRDRVAGTTIRVSVSRDGTQGNEDSFPGSISADGRFVAFESAATNLVSGDTNGRTDVFVRDLMPGWNYTHRVSTAFYHTQSDRDSHIPTLSTDGRWIAYTSEGSTLVDGDTNNSSDVFIRKWA